MFDTYNRDINYLRISVTDKCNLRCNYCMPTEGVKFIPHSEILSLEEIIEFTKVAVQMGIRRVRVTGGEPLVRKNIVFLIQNLSKINSLNDLSMTTNGILLSEFADDLKTAGLMRINISMDTTNAEEYFTITNGGNIQDLFNGIESAIKAGLTPVKINCVIKNSKDEPDALLVRRFCEQKNIEVRFIRQMNLIKGDYSVVEGGSGGNCKICNRLRLTCDGYLKPCLFNDVSVNIRNVSPQEALRFALNVKPLNGSKSMKNQFHNIGG
jgi:GTP 3',8-cyclase